MKCMKREICPGWSGITINNRFFFKITDFRMHKLDFTSDGRPPETILLLGAHCDDIEIGCGGTVRLLTRQFPGAKFHWVVFSSNPARAKEANKSAIALLNEVNYQIDILDFRNGFFPYIGAQIKEYFESLKKSVNPDLIFTHYRNDLHQDHRILSELAWNTFRDHLILEYEIPKFDGDLGQPNLFVSLSKEDVETKIKNILENFISQNDKQWFTADTFVSMLRIRGIEANSPSGYAEAFYARKICFT